MLLFRNSHSFYLPHALFAVYGTTVQDAATATGRDLCDLARWNLVTDVTVVPNVGQTFLIPAEVCEPDNTSCVLTEEGNPQAECLLSGPRLYYTQGGDTYDIIAMRLGMNVSAITSSSNGSPDGMYSSVNTSEVLDADQFMKIPQCEYSVCEMMPYSFGADGAMVYKDLADAYNTTAGQMIALNPTYNYSSNARQGGTPPPITPLYNCRYISDNTTAVLE